MVVVPVDQTQDQASPNQQEPQDTNPPPHIPNPPPLPAQVPDQDQPPNQPPNLHQINCLTLHNKHQCNHLTLKKNPPNPMQPQAPPAQMPQLSWSYFKPEFSGKPEQDMIAHLLRTNDWMEHTTFQRKQRYRDFV